MPTDSLDPGSGSEDGSYQDQSPPPGTKRPGVYSVDDKVLVFSRKYLVIVVALVNLVYLLSEVLINAEGFIPCR